MIRVGLLLGIAALPAVARSAPPPPQADADILVRGKTAHETERFVEAVTPPDRGRQLARWNGPICAEIENLDPVQAGFLLDRLRAAAGPLAVPVTTHCAPNLRIVFTDDGNAFAAAIVRRMPRLMRDEDDGRASSGEVAALLASRPVRWFAASRTVNGSGGRFFERFNKIYSVSRIQQSTREDLANMVIVVDAAHLQEATWSQLGDYLAMVTLARPDPAARYERPTILAIFQPGQAVADRPPELTPGDRDLLHALYAVDPRASPAYQRSQIAARISRPRR